MAKKQPDEARVDDPSAPTKFATEADVARLAGDVGRLRQELEDHLRSDPTPPDDPALERAQVIAAAMVEKSKILADAADRAGRRMEPVPLAAISEESSGPIGRLAAALAEAQAEIANPTKDKSATIASDKGKYSYDYADLATVLDTVRAPLAKRGIAILQFAGTPERGIVQVRTVLAHASGEWVGNVLRTVVGDARPQAIGSAITYLRRYGLQGLVGVAAEADDDASSAQGVPAVIGQRQRRMVDVDEASAPPPAEPGAEPSRAAETVGTRDAKKISDAQRTRLNAIVTERAKELGVPRARVADKVRDYLKALGVESSKDLPAGRYDEVVRFAERATAEGDREPGEDG